MTTPVKTTLTFLTCLTLPLAIPVAATAEPTAPTFDAANFAAGQPNPYFPLDVGTTYTMFGTLTETGLAAEAEADAEEAAAGDTAADDATEADAEAAAAIPDEQGIMTVIGAGPMILDVQTTAVLDEAFKDGLIIERTLDYFATDADGNLWYFGEDVTNYRYDNEDRLTGTDTDSTWRAGVNAAVPGISIPANPTVGLSLFQEQAPAEGAMDYFEVVAVDLTITGPAGEFTGVFQTFESNAAEPGSGEFKFWAPGQGMIRAEEDLSEARDDPEMIVELQPAG